MSELLAARGRHIFARGVGFSSCRTRMGSRRFINFRGSPRNHQFDRLKTSQYCLYFRQTAPLLLYRCQCDPEWKMEVAKVTSPLCMLVSQSTWWFRRGQERSELSKVCLSLPPQKSLALVCPHKSEKWKPQSCAKPRVISKGLRHRTKVLKTARFFHPNRNQQECNRRAHAPPPHGGASQRPL